MTSKRRQWPDDAGCSAWHPGISPEIPHAYRALETIVRPDCVNSPMAEVDEFHQLTGLPREQLAVFRPERLMLHEVIVRVTADIAVAEGDEEEDFGRNFRQIARTILERYVAPHGEAIARAYAEVQEQAGQAVRDVLAATLFASPPAAPSPALWSRLFGARASKALAEAPEAREHRIVADYKRAGLATEDPLQRAVFKSLYRVLGSMAAKRGRLGADQDLLATLVTRHVCNSYGSQRIGLLIAPWVDAAIEAEAYTRVGNSAHPILISLKGASAAGKSSLRPMLKQVLREQGVAADAYATISPDIWRRLLIDYEALGPARKYGAPLTGRELMVIDGKLDRYIRYKAQRDHAVPNFVVDRFRFDSFSSEQVARVLHNTYARYIDTMYMYFVVTPPEETVERGWQRALERGRYKAVEDFLGHSVEAYTGMPRILFKWLACERPTYHYQFLDNRVPKGTYPTTIATGTQAELTVFDPVALVDIERYQKINVNARAPAEVYPDAATLAVPANCGFLKELLRRIPRVEFADPASKKVYLRVSSGGAEVLDAELWDRLRQDAELAAVLAEVAPGAGDKSV